MAVTQFNSSASHCSEMQANAAALESEALRDADASANKDSIDDAMSEWSSQELPNGISRLGNTALACEKRLTPTLKPAYDSFGAPQKQNGAQSGAEPVKLAVFDFDKTSINGNSPVILVRELVRRGMLSASAIARILVWGLAYRMRLPENESWARSLVFTAFDGKPVCEVNAFLRRFYCEKIAHLFRAPIAQLMEDYARDGCAVVCLSATFEPIIAQAMCDYPIQFGIATRMHIDENNCYTNDVEGLPVEGDEKVAILTAFADSLFGKGGWELGWAYGDHHSDRPLLAAAQHGVAVMPDKPLARAAAEDGYEILRWDTT